MRLRYGDCGPLPEPTQLRLARKVGIIGMSLAGKRRTVTRLETIRQHAESEMVDAHRDIETAGAAGWPRSGKKKESVMKSSTHKADESEASDDWKVH